MKKQRTVLFFSAVVLTLAFLLFMPMSKRLCLSYAGNREIITLFDGNVSGFIISYTHSVNRGRVRDFYTLLTDGRICLTHTAFTSYGAGMPEPTGDQVFKITEDALEISNINLELDELILQTGVIADHHIEVAGKILIMNKIVPPQTRIAVGVRRVSCFEIYRKEREPWI